MEYYSPEKGRKSFRETLRGTFRETLRSSVSENEEEDDKKGKKDEENTTQKELVVSEGQTADDVNTAETNNGQSSGRDKAANNMASKSTVLVRSSNNLLSLPKNNATVSNHPVSIASTRRPTTTVMLKDLNFKMETYSDYNRAVAGRRFIELSKADLLMKALKFDVHFLQRHNLMDYSVLLGVHFLSDEVATDESATSAVSDFKVSTKTVVAHDSNQNFSAPAIDNGKIATSEKSPTNGKVSTISVTPAEILANFPWPTELPQSAADAVNVWSNGLPALHRLDGQAEPCLIFLGIIDILQTYDMTKTLEHIWKAKLLLQRDISAVNPNLYGNRFLQFMRSCFVQNSDVPELVVGESEDISLFADSNDGGEEKFGGG